MKNQYRVEGNVVYIQLDRKDGTSVETMISIEDLELVSSVSGKWYLNKYVKISSFRVNGKKTSVQLHRFILGVNASDPRSTEVDHRDRNPLNNTRDNLRIATRSQNNKNRNPYFFGKGINQNSAGNWRATIGNTHLGTFKTKDEAIEARRRAVEEIESQRSNIGVNYRTTPR